LSAKAEALGESAASVGGSRELVAVIRIRGTAGVPPDVEATLRMLRLVKKYHAVVYPKNKPGLLGMLAKVKDWVAWGEVSKEALVELLRRRGRVPGGKRLTDEYVREKLGLSGIEELAEKLMKGELELHKLEHVIKPVFRLAPPKGGFKRSIKKPFKAGGELGYQGDKINELILRMA